MTRPRLQSDFINGLLAYQRREDLLAFLPIGVPVVHPFWHRPSYHTLHNAWNPGTPNIRRSVSEIRDKETRTGQTRSEQTLVSRVPNLKGS